MVAISSPALGTLVNQVTSAEAAPAWTFGVRALMANLAGRGLLS
jgi:fumarylacetoacetate (FAA) hydrolase family protein